MNKLRFSITAMVLTILVVTGFQSWWLRQVYREEKRSLQLISNISFRDAVFELQGSRLRLDSGGLPVPDGPMKIRMAQKTDLGAMLQILKTRVKDSAVNADRNTTVMIARESGPDRLVEVLASVDSLQDSLTVEEVGRAFSEHMKRQGIRIDAAIHRDTSSYISHRFPEPDDNSVTVGFTQPVTYSMHLLGMNAWLFKKLWPQLLLSLALVSVTILSFLLLYRNWMAQRRITELKNEFISNITHELKTPIATVSVAIEALKGFDALKDPARTKEYLHISGLELQRLSLLVDKVLKLSMFERQEITLNPEIINLPNLVNEVLQSMRLQTERVNASIQVQTPASDLNIKADRLHLQSVVYNLVDNAIKYSKGNPAINIELEELPESVQLTVTDNGIGIAPEYRDRIFEKFFRVPSGDRHNVKGYGLGLSYLACVVQLHRGRVQVESQPGIGTKFIIQLPK